MYIHVCMCATKINFIKDAMNLKDSQDGTEVENYPIKGKIK